ncbi:penicillin-binding protein [Deinococcus radiopugnans]|uniref:Penicillin-binding protein n=2 Tax=Deinococcus radiopugnans TaxID=57497 RepID=A0A0A7KHT2_9DEIO|nr:penicillin-binding protein 2 [Deinococcus radiopugnans]AIZ45701.1 penicillin-binding protein [Deinococcus radiopugnans]MBB6016967.1 cell division protein FtsI (penicillin-binding protein 3) [Deinococcus radiopugnans ATCC 19172]QLG11461.1 penicillin-binding protein 2 [Deinococcus sp. D7000]TNM71514.1 penicillin-binding protein 2 [Deinococcus radiopugnans ATCC 19172]
MEVKIRNRSRLMQVVATVLFLSLVWAYAQLEWNVPSSVGRSLVQSRGTITSSDGKVLAQSVDGKRVYPQGHLAGQVLGMMGTTDGLEGLEYAYDRSLASGQDLRLTINTSVQAAAESALRKAIPEHEAEYGSVVVMETRTGRVLAAASYPAFDPNHWRDYSLDARRNRPFLDVYEPGSVIKGLVVAAAINEGLTTPKTVYETPMNRHVGGRWGSVIHDAVDHPSTLTTKQILRYSSNVGMSHIVEKFGSDKLRAYFTQYGFGSYPDMPVVPAATGQLQPLRKWDDLVRVTNAFGQGMSATTLQLASAYNALANDGLYLPPQLVEGVAGPAEKREIVRPEVARTTRTMLQAVIEEGIPHQAGIKGYALGGKTGTAQVVVDGRYSSTIYNSVFTGFYPVDAPQITVVAMAHGAKLSYHGSMLAAPVFREIMKDVLSTWGAAPRIEAPKAAENEK